MIFNLLIFFLPIMSSVVSLSLSLSLSPSSIPILLIICVVCSSFSKKSNNAQGVQYRVNPSPVNSTEPNSTYAARTMHNGTHLQPQMHGKL